MTSEIISAKDNFHLDRDEMETRSLKSRESINEPEFLVSGTSSRWIGLYFGVGFRKIRLNVSDNFVINDSDGEANGIGVNLGYYWKDQSLEIERQTTIVKNNQTFSHEGQKGEYIELIQNNFWYINYPKLSSNFYFHYGTGIQFTKISFARTDIPSPNNDELAFGLETGFSYFFTSNLLIYYRFALGQTITTFSKSSSTFLNQSQLHTFYINYFFPL